jgi:modification methylase
MAPSGSTGTGRARTGEPGSPPTASRHRARPDISRTADLPLAVWPCAQSTGQWQRHGRYLPESNRHPAKMLPEIARRAISFYSKPGDLVLDPMCGIATTLVEAIHQDRRAIGVELEPRWASLAAKNIVHAREQGARGQALVLQDDAGRLGRGVLDEYAGQVALILTSPPYANAMLGDPRGGHGIARARACEGRRVTAADRAHASRASRSCRYGPSAGSVARLRYGTIEETLAPTLPVGHAGRAGHGESYLSSMAAIYTACARMLKPGGYLILVTRNMRANGALRNITGDTIRLCEHAGLVYQQHIVALLATIRDSRIVPRPSFWQLTHVRRSLAKGEPTQLACHEDVLVFQECRKHLSSRELNER